MSSRTPVRKELELEASGLKKRRLQLFSVITELPFPMGQCFPKNHNHIMILVRNVTEEPMSDSSRMSRISLDFFGGGAFCIKSRQSFRL